MRRVPASVAVITVAHHDPETNKHVPMGIAVSSLSTVTLDPPTVSFNIKQPSQALNAIRAADGHLRVHFLAASKMGRKIVEGSAMGTILLHTASELRTFRYTSLSPKPWRRRSKAPASALQPTAS